MWQLVSLALLIVLAAVTVAGQLRERKILDNLRNTLESAGDNRAIPTNVDGAIDRLDHLVRSDETDEMERRVGAALDLINNAAVIVDTDGQEIMRNELAQPYASGRHGDALIENVIQGRLRDALSGDVTDEEIRLHGPPEQVFVVVGSPLVDKGEILGAVVLVDDVSEQHRLDKVRRDFVSNVSHELRTPVGAISLLAEAIQGENDPAIVENFLGRIQDETGRLAQLIDDLLDLSRIEGGVDRQIESVSLATIMELSAAAVRAAADHKNIDLTVDVGDHPIIIDGDQTQLTSAVTNLFSNAIKYTNDGGSVSGRLVSHGAEIALVVEDTGIGIPAREHSRVFERFYRVDRGRASRTGGTGLGLSIVRNVAVNHGGRVELTSQEGVGSTFSIILPSHTSPNDAFESIAIGDLDD